jgi:cbb3-type cytochrome oxidase subunit 3
MFVDVWVVFLFTGVLMAGLCVLWASRTGQFEQQDRARYLPLQSVPPAELSQKPAGRRGGSFWLFVGGNAIIAGCGLVALGATALVVWSTL